MSLIRQVWILIMGTIVLASAGSVLMSVWTARGSLETQLSMKNNDNAQTLALSLSQQRGDAALLELLYGTGAIGGAINVLLPQARSLRTT